MSDFIEQIITPISSNPQLRQRILEIRLSHDLIFDQGSKDEPDNRISVIEVAKGTVVASIETGTAAHGVDISDDGRSVFVTNVDDDTVTAIDIAPLKVTATYEVGDGPNGITYLEP